MQHYQFDRHMAGRRMVNEISALSRGNAERAEKREQLAQQLGVAEDQVMNIALNCLMEALAAQADAEQKPSDPAD